MKNFARALRFAWPYKYRVVGSVVCALLAALFWSLNFTAIYPILKIISSDQNLQEWVNNSIRHIQKDQIEPLEKDIERLSQYRRDVELWPANGKRDTEERKVSLELAKKNEKLTASQSELYNNQLAKYYIDWLFPTDRFQTLVAVICFVILAMFLKGFFEFWQESLVGGVVNKSLFDLRNLFFRRSVNYDGGNFSETGTHELMARFTNDMDLLGNGLKMLFGRVIAEPLRAIGCVVFACLISWQLTLMFLVLVPVALYILTRVGRLMKRATRRVLEHMSNIYKILQETFLGIKIVKAFGRESWERRRFREATLQHYRKSMRVIYLDALAGPLIEVMGVAAVTGALLAGAYLVLNRETHLFGLRMMQYPMSAESLIQLYVLLAAIADPVRKLSSVFTKIQSAAAASDRIFQYLDREPTIGGNVTGPGIPSDFQEIHFKDVCFSYDPGHPVLNGIDLTVRRGETIAIVGKNGCGKSTLLALLPRFFDPDHGSILIDGVDLRQANLRSMRRQVALVTQDTLLFDDTLLNNIGYGKRHATREEIERAAVLAQAHDFIRHLPNGYDTRAGEAGAKLSGGQKQRISLARAILRDPSILILDEFTSAADAETELEVHRLLRDFMKGRTTFIITHRLNTLEIADRIVVIEAGRILAVGKHAELMQSCTMYQRLQEATMQRMAA